MKYIILVVALLIGTPAHAADAISADTKIDEATQTKLAVMNKKMLLDFLKSSRTDNFSSFYKEYSGLTGKMSESAFARKFADYKELPDDIAAIEQQEFTTHEVTRDAGNKYCPGKLLTAKSLMTVQIVQDGHKYTITTKACPTGTDYKLVSFKIGYMEN